MREAQVAKDHYSFQKYFYKGRWMSYYYQLQELFDVQGLSSVLEIGPGTTLVRDQLNVHRPVVSYKTLDIATDLKPDFTGSAESIPCAKNSFDVVCAFQVLEHIPYEKFIQCLEEMLRVSQKKVIFSIPYTAAELSFSIKIPFLNKIQWFVRIPFPVNHVFDGQHYWELGKKHYSPRRIRKDILKVAKIEKEYTPFENQHHRFYVLSEKS